jgi:hypothetical protein
VLPPPGGRQRSAASADEYALSTKDYLTGLITAEEKYEKDFRIPDSGRLHAGRDGLRSCANPCGQADGQVDDERQEKEQEETQTSSFGRQRGDSERGSEEEITQAFFL